MRRIFTTLTLFLIVMAVQPAHAQSALGPGMYDHTVPQIIYGGAGVTWSTITDGTGYGGSRINSGITTSTNPIISINIWGGGFTLYISTNINGGTGNVCVDGDCTSFSWYSASSAFSTINYTGLSYGTHSITVQKTSTTSTAINLDALYVAPPPNPPTSNPPTPIVVVTINYPTLVPTVTGTQYVWVGNFPESTPETTPEHQASITIAGQASIINYEIRPFDVVIVVMLGFLVIIAGTSFIVRLWGLKND